MRAGQLRHRVRVLSLTQDMEVRAHGCRAMSIRTKDAGDVPAASGLRVPALVDVRARWSAELQQGRYLVHGARLLRITSARDFRGDRAELAMSCEEFVGIPATVQREGLAPLCCRLFLAFDVPFLNAQYDQAPVLRTYAEVALIEAGRVEEGDQLEADGVRYTVLSLAKDRDDGVVRGLWLEAES